MARRPSWCSNFRPAKPQPPEGPPQRPGRRPQQPDCTQQSKTKPSSKRVGAGTFRGRLLPRPCARKTNDSAEGSYQEAECDHSSAEPSEELAACTVSTAIPSWASTAPSTLSLVTYSTDVVGIPDADYYMPVREIELSSTPKASREHAQFPKCPSGDHAMLWTTPSTYEVYFCNACGSLGSGNRWHCSEHHDDYCGSCWPYGGAMLTRPRRRTMMAHGASIASDACCAADGCPMAFVERVITDVFICNVCCGSCQGSRWHCGEHQDVCCLQCYQRHANRFYNEDSIAPESCSLTLDEPDAEQSLDNLAKVSTWCRGHPEEPPAMSSKTPASPIGREGSVCQSFFDRGPSYTAVESPARVASSHGERLRRLLDPPPFAITSSAQPASSEPKAPLPRPESTLPAVPSTSSAGSGRWRKLSPFSLSLCERQEQESSEEAVKNTMPHLPALAQDPQPEVTFQASDSLLAAPQSPHAQPRIAQSMTMASVVSTASGRVPTLSSFMRRQQTKNSNASKDVIEELSDDELEYQHLFKKAFHCAEERQEPNSMSAYALAGCAHSLQISVTDARLAKQAFDHVDTDGDGLLTEDGFHMAAIELLKLINRGHFLELVERTPDLFGRTVSTRNKFGSNSSEDNLGHHIREPPPDVFRPSDAAIARISSMTAGHWRMPDKQATDPIELREFLYWYSLIGFREELLLTDDELVLRTCARKYGIPSDVVDSTLNLFTTYDSNHDGMIDYGEFEHVVHKLMKVKLPESLPKSRLKHFWSEIDKLGEGKVDFEGFLTWWMKHYDVEERQAAMPYESFYAQVRRLGPMHLDPPIRPWLAAQEALESDDNAGDFADFGADADESRRGSCELMGSRRGSCEVKEGRRGSNRKPRGASHIRSSLHMDTSQIMDQAHSLAQEAHALAQEAQHLHDFRQWE